MGLNEANIYNELRAIRKDQAAQHKELVGWLAAIHVELKRIDQPDPVPYSGPPPRA